MLHLMLLTSSWAAEPVSVGLSAGLEYNASDPWVRTVGGRLSAHVRPVPWIGGAVVTGFAPNFGTAGWTSLTKEIVNENNVSPDISTIQTQGRLMAEVVPVRSRVGRVEANLVFGLGGGVVHTRDDVEALQAQGDPVAEAVASQIHPVWAWGVATEIRRDRFGGRVRVDQLRYREQIEDHPPMSMRPLWVGLDLCVWLGPARDRTPDLGPLEPDPG